MTGWENFYIAGLGASAALAGLVFVSLSINLTKILSFGALPSRTFEALVVLLVVLFMSSVLLVPGRPRLIIGAEVLLVGLIDWAIIAIIQVNYLRKTDPQYRRAFIPLLLLGQIATLPFVIAGIIRLLHGYDVLYWTVPAALFSFLLALTEAWVLLVEINR